MKHKVTLYGSTTAVGLYCYDTWTFIGKEQPNSDDSIVLASRFSTYGIGTDHALESHGDIHKRSMLLISGDVSPCNPLDIALVIFKSRRQGKRRKPI